MQNGYGIFLKKKDRENITFFQNNIVANLNHLQFRTFSNGQLAYGYEINSRASFKNEISIGKGLKILLMGDFVNKNLIEEKIKMACGELKNNTDIYDYFKNEIWKYFGQIDGVYSLIIVDTIRNRFYVISDPSGMIPIYYYNDNDVFIFGTSLKCILSCSKIPRILNQQALYETFKLGFIIPPTTLIENVKMLMPGEILEFSEAIYTHQPTRIDNKADENLDIVITADEYFNQFKNAILNCTKNIQNCSLLLSGGIDSAAIAAIINKHTNIKLKCYTIDFETNNPIELTGAKKISTLFNLEHHVLSNLNNEMIGCFPKVIWYNEAPTFNGVSEYVLCNEIDDKTEMVVTGDGNDLIWSIFNPFPVDFLSKNGLRFSDFYMKVRGTISDQLLDQIVTNPFEKSYTHDKINSIYFDTGNFFSDSSNADMKIFGDCGAFNLFGKLRIQPNDLLFRFPYLNKDLEALIRKVPDSFKLKFENQEYIRKYLFKYALNKHKLLPAEIIHTKKTWMTSPNADWLRGNLKNTFSETVFHKNSAIQNYFNTDIIRQIWSFHLQKKYDFSYLLITLFTLELWHKIFIESRTMEHTCFNDKIYEKI